MQQIRIRRPRVRREHRWHGVLPPGLRDPDVVRAKALARAGDRAGGRTAQPSSSPAAPRQFHRAQPPPVRLRVDRPVAGLLLEGIVLRLQADLRWLEADPRWLEADLRWLEACERKRAGRRSVS